MTARTETVVLSQLLSDLPTAEPRIQATIAAPLLRALDLVPRQPDPDFAATLAAGHVEDVDTWAARVLTPADWQERIRYAACFAHVVTGAWIALLETRIAEARR